jgi:hypothetical protein
MAFNEGRIIAEARKTLVFRILRPLIVQLDGEKESGII